jgi:hypothetical protein
MTIALYAAIWLALVCLVLGELGRRRQRQTGVHTLWATKFSAVGVLLTAAHTLLAIGVAYDWDHARAVQLTAERAATVYGVAWPGSLYVNYVFIAWWAADVTWWWLRPASFVGRPALLEWAWRALVLTMTVNGAIIFASPAGRVAGVPLVAALLFVWWNDRLGANFLDVDGVTSHASPRGRNRRQ